MRKLCVFLMAAVAVFLWLMFYEPERAGNLQKSGSFDRAVDNLQTERYESLSRQPAKILVNGRSMEDFQYQVLLDAELSVLCSRQFLEDVMGCAVVQYPDGKILLERGDEEITYRLGEYYSTDGEGTESLSACPVLVDSGLYLPVRENIHRLGYECQYLFTRNAVNFVKTDQGKNLPEAYDLRTDGRITPVRDQGVNGTCWAFASLGAVESTLMPMQQLILSPDHLSRQNGYSRNLNGGGEHTMSLAYMASWKGPVLEQEDPYGDGKTEEDLSAVRHLEEAVMLKDGDLDTIKNAIYKYGGVEASLYMAMSYGGSSSRYYNPDTAAYCYDGDEESNHDVVIAGWDDHFSREKFSNPPVCDGAFLCKNSWGKEFGEDGYFYVSYEDVNISRDVVVYTRTAPPDDYDRIYQSDLLGWVGQIGFGREQAYFANAYAAAGDENLSAVSFYATGRGSSFTVYVVPEFTGSASLKNMQEVMTGEIRYAGYYTADFPVEIPLQKGQKFAVVVKIQTPGTTRPIAVECPSEDFSVNPDLSDGEGYVSMQGTSWKRSETLGDTACNVCLKAFTRRKEMKP